MIYYLWNIWKKWRLRGAIRECAIVWRRRRGRTAAEGFAARSGRNPSIFSRRPRKRKRQKSLRLRKTALQRPSHGWTKGSLRDGRSGPMRETAGTAAGKVAECGMFLNIYGGTWYLCWDTCPTVWWWGFPSPGFCWRWRISCEVAKKEKPPPCCPWSFLEFIFRLCWSSPFCPEKAEGEVFLIWSCSLPGGLMIGTMLWWWRMCCCLCLMGFSAAGLLSGRKAFFGVRSWGLLPALP